VWSAVTGDGWLADQVEFDLCPGGDARFRSADGEKRGWVEDVCAPAAAGDGTARLAFWWATGDEPATRVELTIESEGDGAARVRVIETRPLELLDLVGTPLPGAGGANYGPALVAA
jgi:uncharacterized protein YndB with AHSA1/START domain